MEDPRWLKLLTVGLVLAALAVGYFLFTGRFSSNSATKKVPQASQVPPTASPSATITPTPSVIGQMGRITTISSSPAPTSPSSAYSRIIARTQDQEVQDSQGGIQALPRTGFPLQLAVMLSISVMVSGWGLRRFPR